MKKDIYKKEFDGKKITIMGLGVLGRGIQVSKFLASCGAKLTVTDLKSEKDLSASVRALKKYKIRYVLGKHEISDFENVDMVVKAAGVPLDSIYIKHAKALKIAVVMDASLFAKTVKNVTPKITVIGITGTRGKSMTTSLIYHILKSNEKFLKSKVHLGGNMRMKATLPILKEVSSGDFVVLELDSWQCQGFGDEKLSPNIAVFTSFMPDHMNYYKNSMKKYLDDKSNIFKFQKSTDVFVTNKNVLKILKNKPKGKLILTNTNKVSKIPMHIFGEHNVQNTSYAFEVAKQCGLSDLQIKQSLKTFKGLEGRLEYLKNIKGVHIINDNNATTPEATVAGILAVRSKYKKSQMILLSGGASKKLSLDNLVKTIKKYCKKVVLLSGTGTEELKKILDIKYDESSNLKQAVKIAIGHTKKDDVVLFSPAFASFGLFKHEYDRNDQFVKIIRKWK